MVLRPYMLVPLVVWLALRFDQGAVMAALFLLTCVALTSAVGKTGYFPWPVEDLAGRLLTVQIFLGVIASTGMLLSAIHTEQQRAEEALKVAHQKLDATLNALPDLLFEVDESWRFYNYRAPKRRNLFAPPEVFLGRSVEQVLPPECARVAMEAIREAAASGSSVGRSYPLFMPEGPKWFELSVAKQESMPGSDKRLIVLARDITERKKADEALRESEARFSKFFHNSPAGMGYSAMLDNKFVDVNEAFAKIFGFTREEIIGHTSAELGLWPVSRQREWVAAEVKKHGRVLGFEAKFRKKSGEVGDLLVSAESIMLTGREHLLGVILPITELKQAEEALQETHKLLSLFIQESPIYAYIAEVTPTQIRILQASRNFRKMPGLICCDVVGKTLTELFPQEFAEKISTDDRRVIASGEVLKVEEEFGGHSYSTIKFPIALSDKTLLAGYTIDITEQKRAQAMLLQLMEAKARFTASVSHELRSPLATIKAATELVREGLAGPVNDQQKDLLDTAQKNIERLGRLINNVLVYQKTQAGKEAFDFQENDLHEVIREAYKSAVLFAGDRSADLVLELAKDLPAMKFDKDKILQVLLNLVSNAVKYSEKGNIVIQTRCEQGGVSVSVRDSGPGIKAGRLEAIFEPFSQAGNDRKGGTGLGLSIAREIVLAHHGRIWAESEEGKGSVFHFTLPL